LFDDRARKVIYLALADDAQEHVEAPRRQPILAWPGTLSEHFAVVTLIQTAQESNSTAAPAARLRGPERDPIVPKKHGERSMFEDLRPLSEAEVTEQVANIARDGFSVMPGAVSPADQRTLLAELDRLESVRPGGDFPKSDFIGQVTRRWVDLLNDADVWQDVAVHPWILQVMPHVLGDDFLLSAMATAVIGPGEAAQGIHDDDGVYRFPRPHPNLVCNTMWALTDFTEDVGATRLVPGSNNWPSDPEAGQAYRSVPLLMPAGAIGFVVGSCYHGGGANVSNRDRPALTINYCNGAMRQQENFMLAVHPARMRTFRPDLQDLLGFKQCFLAGHIFGGHPRVELERHYPTPDANDGYLARRDGFHAERTTLPEGYI
jgi:hypothetical protein